MTLSQAFWCSFDLFTVVCVLYLLPQFKEIISFFISLRNERREEKRAKKRRFGPQITNDKLGIFCHRWYRDP